MTSLVVRWGSLCSGRDTRKPIIFITTNQLVKVWWKEETADLYTPSTYQKTGTMQTEGGNPHNTFQAFSQGESLHQVYATRKQGSWKLTFDLAQLHPLLQQHISSWFRCWASQNKSSNKKRRVLLDHPTQSVQFHAMEKAKASILPLLFVLLMASHPATVNAAPAGSQQQGTLSINTVTDAVNVSNCIMIMFLKIIPFSHLTGSCGSTGI